MDNSHYPSVCFVMLCSGSASAHRRTGASRQGDVTALTSLRVSSWEISGDKGNYPVYIIDVITPLWEVTRGVCRTHLLIYAHVRLCECVRELITGASVGCYLGGLEAYGVNI